MFFLRESRQLVRRENIGTISRVICQRHCGLFRLFLGTRIAVFIRLQIPRLIIKMLLSVDDFLRFKINDKFDGGEDVLKHRARRKPCF